MRRPVITIHLNSYSLTSRGTVGSVKTNRIFSSCPARVSNPRHPTSRVSVIRTSHGCWLLIEVTCDYVHSIPENSLQFDLNPFTSRSKLREPMLWPHRVVHRGCVLSGQWHPHGFHCSLTWLWGWIWWFLFINVIFKLQKVITRFINTLLWVAHEITSLMNLGNRLRLNYGPLSR